MYREVCRKAVRTLVFCAVLGAVMVSTSVFAATLPGPKISAAPKSLKFANTKAGGTSDNMTVTVLNTGTQDLVISSLDITGTNASEFNLVDPGVSTIAPAGSTVVTLAFSPVAPFGKKSALLSISSNDPKKPVLNVKLMGADPGPKVSASPMSVNFGTLDPGTPATPVLVTVLNTGVSDLNVSSATIAGTDAADFSVTGDIPPALANLGTFTLSVAFTPDSPGKKSALLQVASNDPKKPLLSIKLMGAGTTPPSSGSGGGTSSYSKSDLVGTWEIHEVQGGSGNGWSRGPITVASDATFNFQESDSGGGSQLISGTMSITSAGVATPKCPTCGDAPAFNMDADKTVMNLMKATDPEIGLVVKGAASYATSDLAGTWDMQQFDTGTASGWKRSSITIASDGTFTGTETDSNGASQPIASTLTISADGSISVVGDNNPTQQLNMDAGKTVIAGSKTNGSGNAQVTVLLKEADSYTTADLAGTWSFAQLKDGVAGAMGEIGSVSISSGGNVTGSAKKNDGTTDNLAATLSISATGEVTVAEDQGSLGHMDASKNVVVLTSANGNGDFSIIILTRK